MSNGLVTLSGRNQSAIPSATFGRPSAKARTVLVDVRTKPVQLGADVADCGQWKKRVAGSGSSPIHPYRLNAIVSAGSGHAKELSFFGISGNGNCETTQNMLAADTGRSVYFADGLEKPIGCSRRNG